MKKAILCVCIATLTLVGCTSKPSKPEVKKSFNRILTKEFGSKITADQKSKLNDYVNCIVDDSYDHISAGTLKKIVDAKTTDDLSSTSGTKSEKSVLDKAATKCQSKFGE